MFTNELFLIFQTLNLIMMKKLILLIALVISGTAMAQVPQEAQITEAQKQNTKRVEARVSDMNQKVSQELNAIISGITVSKSEKEAIAELVTSKIASISKLNAQGLAASAKATQVTNIMSQYKEQLAVILGPQRFASIEQLLK